MNTTIIVSNPSKDSFSKKILESVKNGLDRKNKSYNIIDLYEDNFNPIMTQKQLELYSSGQTDDDLVKEYQSNLKESDEIILIFPIWYNNVPAMLKGFFDKVFVKEFAFTEEYKRPKGLLTNIKSGILITTSESDTEYIKNELNDPITNTIINGTLSVVGMNNIKWINNNLASSNDNKKQQFLDEINKYF